jgi:hypothetical protein
MYFGSGGLPGFTLTTPSGSGGYYSYGCDFGPRSDAAPMPDVSAAEVFSTSYLTLVVVGAGAVTVSPGGMSCQGTCVLPFPAETAVTLQARPAGFLGWSGSCTGTGACTVTLHGDQDVTARW